MKLTSGPITVLMFFAWFVSASNFGGAGFPQEKQLEDYELVKKIVVLGHLPWTETGLEVRKGEELFFTASGTISLQRDNPVAVCGPEGLNLMTQQQPIPGQNIGALIGRVLEKIEVGTDKQTGDKTQREVGQLFFIGIENKVVLPADGRLRLGINEFVVGDNSGEFAVAIYRKK